jgi:HNH endonuclease
VVSVPGENYVVYPIQNGLSFIWQAANTTDGQLTGIQAKPRRRRFPITDGKKRCSSCHEWQDLSEFHRNTKDGYQGNCKTCSHRNYVEWRSRNPGRLADLHRDWREHNWDRWNEGQRLVHNRRRAKGGQPIRMARWRDILLAFDWKCYSCGANDVPLGPEHLTPIVRGGDNGRGNIAPACLRCNVRKGRRTVEEFLPSRASEVREKALWADRIYLLEG